MSTAKDCRKPASASWRICVRVRGAVRVSRPRRRLVTSCGRTPVLGEKQWASLPRWTPRVSRLGRARARCGAPCRRCSWQIAVVLDRRRAGAAAKDTSRPSGVIGDSAVRAAASVRGSLPCRRADLHGQLREVRRRFRAGGGRNRVCDRQSGLSRTGRLRGCSCCRVRNPQRRPRHHGCGLSARPIDEPSRRRRWQPAIECLDPVHGWRAHPERSSHETVRVRCGGSPVDDQPPPTPSHRLKSSSRRSPSRRFGSPARRRSLHQWKPDHTYDNIRQGDNKLVCYDRSDERDRSPFAAQCTNLANLPREAQNRKIRSETKNTAEESARIAAAEKDGTRVKPECGSLWLRMDGRDKDNAMLHVVIAMPGATSAGIGLPDNGQAGGAWLMEAGTSAAHIMVPGQFSAASDRRPGVRSRHHAATACGAATCCSSAFGLRRNSSPNCARHGSGKISSRRLRGRRGSRARRSAGDVLSSAIRAPCRCRSGPDRRRRRNALRPRAARGSPASASAPPPSTRCRTRSPGS